MPLVSKPSSIGNKASKNQEPLLPKKTNHSDSSCADAVKTKTSSFGTRILGAFTCCF